MTLREKRWTIRLHWITEALLYAWLTGLILPHTNALYNLGLFGAPLAGITYIFSSQGTELKRLPRIFSMTFYAFGAWSFLSCFWATEVDTALVEWRGNPGIAVMTSWLYACIFQSSSSQRRFWQFIVLLSSVLAAMYIIEWLSIAQTLGVLIPPYGSLRAWGDRLIFCFPFLLFAAERSDSKRIRLALQSLILIFATLMIVTSARGVWLALAFYILAWALLTNKTKQIIAVSISLLLIFSLSFLVSENPLKARLSNIAYTSDRVNYTWGPAIKFWQDSPIIGIGYGTTAFHKKAEELSQTNKEWLKNAGEQEKEHLIHLGPHSNYFEALAGGGLIGFLILISFYGQVIKKTFFSAKPANLIVAATGSGIFAKYMIHGSVESINWKALGILIGLLLAALAVSPRHVIPEETECKSGGD